MSNNGVTNSGLFSGIVNSAENKLFSNNNKQLGNLFSNIPNLKTGLFGYGQHENIDSKPTLFSTLGANKTNSNLFSDHLITKNQAPAFNNLNSNEYNFEKNEEQFTDFADFEKQKSYDANTINVKPQSSYWPAIKLSRLPHKYNTRSILEKYFLPFGKIQRTVCQPSLNTAYVAFDLLSSAQHAKRLIHDSLDSNENGIPSTVILSMARCRRQTNSTSLNTTEDNVDSLFAGSKMFNRTPKSTGGKRLISSRLEMKTQSNVKTRITKHDKAVISTPNFISTIQTDPVLSLKSFPVDQNMFISKHREPIYAITSDERLSVLQQLYQNEGQKRLLVQNNISHLPFAEMSNTDEPINHAPIKGICLDMCPELERYLRIVHQRVSIFECYQQPSVSHPSANFEMDHKRAVKDYQRSSADQPVPLPRELRPTPVLQRTMSYLLAHIADRPEIETGRSLWKPWYEFMWTRTRAIRKDIRQQSLCCPIIVEVIEHIARFHIFCAARLVDQPIDSFDSRINSENLTQCLQTLKEMYHDLGASHQSGSNLQLCPCEPEFRAYMLLMKLNDQSELK